MLYVISIGQNAQTTAEELRKEGSLTIRKSR